MKDLWNKAKIQNLYIINIEREFQTKDIVNIFSKIRGKCPSSTEEIPIQHEAFSIMINCVQNTKNKE